MKPKTMDGLPTGDLGDWVRRKDRRTGRWIENPKSGFRVYYKSSHPRTIMRMRYIVCKDGFCYGFTLPLKGGYRHSPDPSKEASRVIIEVFGGLYTTDTAFENEGFITLATATYFKSKEQQDAYIGALKDAVPRIPAMGAFSFRWDGGFGFQVEFTKENSEKLKNGEFIQYECS